MQRFFLLVICSVYSNVSFSTIQNHCLVLALHKNNTPVFSGEKISKTDRMREGDQYFLLSIDNSFSGAQVYRVLDLQGKEYVLKRYENAGFAKRDQLLLENLKKLFTDDFKRDIGFLGLKVAEVLGVDKEGKEMMLPYYEGLSLSDFFSKKIHQTGESLKIDDELYLEVVRAYVILLQKLETQLLMFSGLNLKVSLRGESIEQFTLLLELEDYSYRLHPENFILTSDLELVIIDPR